MSIPDTPGPSEPEAPPPTAPRHTPTRLPGQGIGGCLSFALVLGGIALLLPGLCSLWVMGLLGTGESGGVAFLWMITFLIASGGVWLIAWAVRNR